jgi:MFS family permease
MLGLRSFRHLSFAAALHAFYGYGAAFFLPVFMIRVHGFSEGELSTYLALISLFAGGLGTFLGGYLGDRLAVRDPRWYLWLPGASTLIGIPFAALLYLWPDRYQALGFAIPAAFVGGMWLGPTFAITQGLVRASMRALASAILLFIINLVGLGIGPMAVGMLSDAFKAEYAAEAVRYALLIVVTGGAAWSALHYLLAARTLRSDLAARGSGVESASA